MPDYTDWRGLLTASERYDNIQRISTKIAAAGIGHSGFEIENEAYESALCREDYDAACTAALSAATAAAASATDAAPGTPHVPSEEESPETDPDEEPGIQIGPYESCHYVASGVTAEVYRSRDRALKVIVETRDIEPHNPAREAKVLGLLQRPCIPLLETFWDQEQRFVLAFPYMPLTLGGLLDRGSPLTDKQIRAIFADLFTALRQIHSHGIIHRDIKPSAILLASPSGPAYLSDFGTAWHPQLSTMTEPAYTKILDIGTGPYRAPEVLFGNKSYGTAVDMWGSGAMLAECCRRPTPKPLFESRAVHEDGNQLGLILSIFKTIGSPTRETWPEAVKFKTPPFDIYRVFERRGWESVLPEVAPHWRELVSALVRYNSSRATAEQVGILNPFFFATLLTSPFSIKALQYPCLHE
ncbi:kinase-like domain-containing protein [Cercophora newfieldiana]|uniref:cyclin-dependent kinase n=1 Tax=Cercophora newfieldiana TaxID=92897 RepID=A0AA39XWU9_9PEZI|nr:kinase-like domain-containing protein [Cercophora newfieldiana]